MSHANAIQKELMSVPEFGEEGDDDYAYEKKVLKNMKKALLMTVGAAVQKLKMSLENEQEIIMNAADMVSEIYLSESFLLRVEKLQQLDFNISIQHDMLRVYIHDAVIRLENAGRNAIESFAEGDEMKMLLMGLKRYTKVKSFNCKTARRRVAEKLCAENKYCF
jgi:uncharacterized protein